jgi:hypothetical protein
MFFKVQTKLFIRNVGGDKMEENIIFAEQVSGFAHHTIKMMLRGDVILEE